jgi:hypothetical protein
MRRVATILIVCGALASPAQAMTVRDRVTWTRGDGSTVSFARQVRVWCGPWESDVRVPSIHVRVGAGATPRWELHAVLADVKRHPVVRFPNSFVFDHPRGAQFFATDGTNELNSDGEDSSGRVTFDRVRCGRHARIAFRVNATVDSEFSDGEPLKVSGSFRASR